MSKDNAIALLNLGIIALHDRHDSEAMGYFKSALLLDLELAEAYLGLGLVHVRLNNYVEMTESFRQAIKINQHAIRNWAKSSFPTPPVWPSFSPEHAHITGKMAELLRNLDEADALARLAAAHISHGLDNAAVRALEYCLGKVPDYGPAIVLLSLSYLFLEAKEAGAAVRIGQASELKKRVPELAKSLFGSRG